MMCSWLCLQVETGAFNDCILLGGLGQLTFGNRLYSEDVLQLSPILLAGVLDLSPRWPESVPCKPCSIDQSLSKDHKLSILQMVFCSLSVRPAVLLTASDPRAVL
jgi:hypothetical protein